MSKPMMGNLIFGGVVSLINLNGQMWSSLTGSKNKMVADFVYDQGYIVDYDIHKAPVGTNAQELKSFAFDELNVLVSLVGLRAGKGALFEQAGSRAAAAEAGQEAKAIMNKNGIRTPDGKYASSKGNNASSAQAEERVWDAIETKKGPQGWSVQRGRVTVKDKTGQTRVYDGAATSPSGNKMGLEVKSGAAKRTPPQRAFDKRLNANRQNTATGGGTTVNRAVQIKTQ